MNDETKFTAMILAGVIGWFCIVYFFIVHNVMDAMTFTIVPIALIALAWMFVADIVDDIKERRS